MEVSQPKFALRSSFDALTNARSLIHTFQPKPVETALAQGEKIVADAQQKGDQALQEHAARRVWLAASLAPILLVIVLLLLYIRSLPPPADCARQQAGIVTAGLNVRAPLPPGDHEIIPMPSRFREIGVLVALSTWALINRGGGHPAPTCRNNANWPKNGSIFPGPWMVTCRLISIKHRIPRFSKHHLKLGVCTMPNIASVLKAEIARLAKKESKAATSQLKSASVRYRSDIAKLKKLVAGQEKTISRLKRQVQQQPGQPEPAEERARRRSLLAPLGQGPKTAARAVGLGLRHVGRGVGPDDLQLGTWQGPSTRRPACRVGGCAEPWEAGSDEDVGSSERAACEEAATEPGVTSACPCTARNFPVGGAVCAFRCVPLAKPVPRDATVGTPP